MRTSTFEVVRKGSGLLVLYITCLTLHFQLLVHQNVAALSPPFHFRLVMLAWHVLNNGVGVPRQHDLTFRSKRNESCTNMQGRQSDALILKCTHELLHESGGKQRSGFNGSTARSCKRCI